MQRGRSLRRWTQIEGATDEHHRRSHTRGIIRANVSESQRCWSGLISWRSLQASIAIGANNYFVDHSRRENMGPGDLSQLVPHRISQSRTDRHVSARRRSFVDLQRQCVPIVIHDVAAGNGVVIGNVMIDTDDSLIILYTACR